MPVECVGYDLSHRPADRIDELERAAESTRAEHAAALAEANRNWQAQVDEMGQLMVTYCSERNAARVELAEHAAALGLATARIRELEGEREELLWLLCWRCSEYRRSLERARIEQATKGTPR